MSQQRPYTLAEARWILSHTYCVFHVPEDGEAGFSRPWFPGLGNAECCRCNGALVEDLRVWIASEKAAAEWLAVENAASAGLRQAVQL